MVAFVLAATGSYVPGLSGPFIYDDAFNLAPVLSWDRDLTPWQDVVFGNASGVLGRPVAMFSFLATGMAGVTPFHFKLGNLVLHLLIGALGWGFLRRLMREDPALAARADMLAACAMGIWLLHPMFASTVLYAVQRMAQLSTLFAVASLFCYMRAREHFSNEDPRRGNIALFVTVPLLVGLGVLSKENAAIAPLLCLLIEITYPSRSGPMGRSKRWFFLAFAVIPAALFLALLFARPDAFLGGYDQRDFSALERALTQPRVLFDYLAQMIAPRGETMTVYTDGYVASRGLLEPPSTLFALLGLGAFTTAAVLLRRRLPIVFFGWMFFLLAHAVESTILPLDLYYEHRNYLPAIGLFAAVVGGAWLCAVRFTKSNRARQALPGLAVAGYLLLGAGIVERAYAWQQRDTLIAEALAHHPASLRAQLAQVDADLADGDFAAAESRLQAMEDSTSMRQRLTARLEGLRATCLGGGSVDAADMAQAIREHPGKLVNDEVQSVNLLLQKTHSGQCGDFDDHAFGSMLASLADGAFAQDETSSPKIQTRYAAALAFTRSNLHEEALQQASLAWNGGGNLEVGFLLVWNQVKTGDVAGAERTIAQMEQRLPRFNRAAKRALGKAYLVARAPTHGA